MSEVASWSTVPNTVVRNRSRFARVLHRPDPESDEPNPACDLRDSKSEFAVVPTSAYRPHYAFCQNPECFGGER